MEIYYPAHIRNDETGIKVQSCADHCRNAAEYASARLESVGLSACGKLIGLMHDSGKLSSAFKDYLERAAQGLPTQRGSVNHSSAGLRYLLERYHSETDDVIRLSSELLAYAVGAHHGLFDCQNGQYGSAFERRSYLAEEYPTVMERFISDCISEEEIDVLFKAAVEELSPILHILSTLPDDELSDTDADNEFLFYLSLLERLLLSALIDADRRDAAEFMRDIVFPSWSNDRHKIWESCRIRTEQALNGMPSDTPIQKARGVISNLCARAAEAPGGVYRLNIPTGGGKTLSGLRYALVHAEKYSKQRLIFVSPLLSILEQNAAVIRETIGDDSLILEHHSNVLHPIETEDGINMMEFLTETWETPIIVTTLVQLLNTAFSGKSSCIRRFHALADSVIVFDEVQTVPPNLLTLFNLLINFLTEICHSTIILCSATQPELEQTEHSLHRRPPDLVAKDAKLWEIFRRTELQLAGRLKLEDIPDFVQEKLNQTESILVVCNKKAEAEALFQALSDGCFLCFHLSAAMCVQHRRDTLNAIKEALVQQSRTRKKVVCISTQVIEAGVDISFGCVIRFCAGMDSIVQAAGRCNRNGESLAPSPVYIVDCLDEKLTHLEEIQHGKDASVRLFNDFQKTPELYDNDLASDSAIRQYYLNYYGSMDTHAQDAPKNGMTLFDLLSRNMKFDVNDPENIFVLRQAFKTAGSLFSVFDDDTTAAIVAYGEGRSVVEQLIEEDRRVQWDYATIRKLTQSAKPYSVSLREYEIKELKTKGALLELFEGSVFVLLDGYYDEMTGFSINNDQYMII